MPCPDSDPTVFGWGTVHVTVSLDWHLNTRSPGPANGKRPALFYSNMRRLPVAYQLQPGS